MIRPDLWIARMAREQQLIDPFEEGQVRAVESRPVVSYGLSSYGYDFRLDRQFRVFTNQHGAVVDPKNFDARGLVEFEGDVCLIPPNSFALGLTLERFRIPRDVLALCIGKSTYARCGIIVNVTPFEPGWEGRAVIEISNTTPLPARVYAGEGIAQVIFLQSDVACRTTYADRGGKYQGQDEIALPRT
jgi:dCTP deaminase